MSKTREVICSMAAALALAVPPAAVAQTVPGAPTSAGAASQQLSAQQLESIVAPVALYPDDLLAILLPSSTTPLEVVKAQRFLEKRKSNSSLQPDATMPAPVKSLLNYPDVVKKMNDDLDWTSTLGTAVAAQQKDVVAAIQAFRRRVYAVGNLKSDPKQIVIVETETIKIVQADPQVIYVPQYQPAQVVVVQAVPVYAYYPTPYPVYYYPYPPGAAFATGFFVGAATAYAFNWSNATINHNVNINNLQQERMDYANNAREDRQSQIQGNQAQRQGQVSQNQSQRQDAISGTTSANQAQRQQAAANQQGQRQQGATQAQQSAQSASQRSASAAAATQAAGKAWQPTSTSAGSYSRPQSYSGGGAASAQAGAFGGIDSGAAASRAGSRGAQSRSAPQGGRRR